MQLPVCWFGITQPMREKSLGMCCDLPLKQTIGLSFDNHLMFRQFFRTAETFQLVSRYQLQAGTVTLLRRGSKESI